MLWTKRRCVGGLLVDDFFLSMWRWWCLLFLRGGRFCRRELLFPLYSFGFVFLCLSTPASVAQTSLKMMSIRADGLEDELARLRARVEELENELARAHKQIQALKDALTAEKAGRVEDVAKLKDECRWMGYSSLLRSLFHSLNIHTHTHTHTHTNTHTHTHRHTHTHTHTDTHRHTSHTSHTYASHIHITHTHTHPPTNDEVLTASAHVLC
jgi:hypothetical protein